VFTYIISENESDIYNFNSVFNVAIIFNFLTHIDNYIYIVTCWVVHVTEMTGSRSDDWILLSLWLQPLFTTLTYIASPHTL
jgi:hypothetical protein